MNHILYTPFRSAVNPLQDQADAITTQWLRKFSLISNEAIMHSLHEGRFTSMVSRMFPDAHLYSLTLAAELNTLLFIMDDEFDAGDTVGSKVATFSDLLNTLSAIADGKAVDGNEPILRAFRDLWFRLLELGTTNWQIRFRKSFNDALLANLWRMSLIDQRELPSVEAYRIRRPMIGGANFFTLLLLVMEDIELPDYLLDHPDVQELMWLCSSTICTANDIFSYRKELDQGDQMNLVLLLQIEHNLTTAEAVRQAISIHDRDVKAFEQLASKPYLCGNVSDANYARGYAATLGCMMRANIEWSEIDSLRYKEA